MIENQMMNILSRDPTAQRSENPIRVEGNINIVMSDAVTSDKDVFQVGQYTMAKSETRKVVASLKEQIRIKGKADVARVDEVLLWFENYEIFSYPVFLKSKAEWFYDKLLRNKWELPIY